MNSSNMKPPFDVLSILVGGMAFIFIAAAVISALAFVVGETVEHFTP